MEEEVSDEATAREIAETYAAEECIGTFGEVLDVADQGAEWHVEFRTHTFADEYTHRIRLTKSVGNVISHDRSTRFD